MYFVLPRSGHFQEYLYLAEAEGHSEEYVTMLVRLGRVEEAIAYGRQYLATPDEALALAKALYKHGEREQGLQIAEHGLTLEGRKALLAKWLRDTALLMGEQSRALPAAEVAYRDEISLENYQRVARIAGERWPERRKEESHTMTIPDKTCIQAALEQLNKDDLQVFILRMVRQQPDSLGLVPRQVNLNPIYGIMKQQN
jgi:hypothetical protein